MLNCAFGTCFNENLALWSEMGFGGASPRSRQSPEMPQVAAASIFFGRIVFSMSCRWHWLNPWIQVDYVSQKAEAYELEARIMCAVLG